jgi:hypothetical protein
MDDMGEEMEVRWRRWRRVCLLQQAPRHASCAGAKPPRQPTLHHACNGSCLLLVTVRVPGAASASAVCQHSTLPVLALFLPLPLLSASAGL